MYEFHYDYIKQKYGDKAILLYTDTDSLAYEIQTEDFYKDINLYVERQFDISDMPSDHLSGIKSGMNKKVVGMMKDELGGKIMTEFVGLRAKLYTYKMLHEKETKKCKGIKKSVVDKTISFEAYKECKKKEMRKMNVIRSRHHEVFSEEVNKIALSSEDDKRVVMEDGIHTKAYGYYLIPDWSFIYLLPVLCLTWNVSHNDLSFLIACSRHCHMQLVMMAVVQSEYINRDHKQCSSWLHA